MRLFDPLGLVSAAFALVLLPVSCAPDRLPRPAIETRATASAPVRLANRFLSEIEQTGLQLPYLPSISEQGRINRTNWLEDQRLVEVCRIDNLGNAERRVIERCGGRPFFDAVFRWFLPVKELSRFLIDEFQLLDEGESSARWSSKIAIAFLQTQSGGSERLERLEQDLKKCLEMTNADPEKPDSPDVAGNPGLNRLFSAILEYLQGNVPPGFEAMISSVVRRPPIPTAVMLDAALDVGFHVAAHLYLPDVDITLFDPEYVHFVQTVRRQLLIPDLLLKTQAGIISRRLNILWQIHHLVRVPALFRDFENTRIAFRLLTGKEQPGPRNEYVRTKLDKFFYPLYPALRDLSANGRLLGEALATLIDYEYKSFYLPCHHLYREKWDWLRRKFRDQWYRHIAPAMEALDADNQILQVAIVLSPALRRHGTGHKIREGIARVAVLLPQNPEEMVRSLLSAFHRVCHGITDPLVRAREREKHRANCTRAEKGKQLQILLEAAANQAMFESLGKKNPVWQERFLEGPGNLAWLGEKDLLAEHALIAGRALSGKRLQDLLDGLRDHPLGTSRKIYRSGLLVPEDILENIRALLRRSISGNSMLDYSSDVQCMKAGVLP